MHLQTPRHIYTPTKIKSKERIFFFFKLKREGLGKEQQSAFCMQTYHWKLYQYKNKVPEANKKKKCEAEELKNQ